MRRRGAHICPIADRYGSAGLAMARRALALCGDGAHRWWSERQDIGLVERVGGGNDVLAALVVRDLIRMRLLCFTADGMRIKRTAQRLPAWAKETPEA